MAEDITPDDGRVSRESFDRVKKDLEAARAKLSEYEPVIADFAFVKDAYSVFKAAGERDPYGLAMTAVADVTVKGTPREELGDKLPAWLQERRSAFTVQPAELTPEAPAPEPKKETPFQVPNPAAPGYPATEQPMVVGSEAWHEFRQGKSGAELEAAVRDGRAVIPDKIRKAHEPLRKGLLG